MTSDSSEKRIASLSALAESVGQTPCHNSSRSPRKLAAGNFSAAVAACSGWFVRVEQVKSEEYGGGCTGKLDFSVGGECDGRVGKQRLSQTSDEAKYISTGKSQAAFVLRTTRK